jgi:hypothetical protein
MSNIHFIAWENERLLKVIYISTSNKSNTYVNIFCTSDMIGFNKCSQLIMVLIIIVINYLDYEKETRQWTYNWTRSNNHLVTELASLLSHDQSNILIATIRFLLNRVHISAFNYSCRYFMGPKWNHMRANHMVLKCNDIYADQKNENNTKESCCNPHVVTGHSSCLR